MLTYLCSFKFSRVEGGLTTGTNTKVKFTPQSIYHVEIRNYSFSKAQGNNSDAKPF